MKATSGVFRAIADSRTTPAPQKNERPGNQIGVRARSTELVAFASPSGNRDLTPIWPPCRPFLTLPPHLHRHPQQQIAERFAMKIQVQRGIHAAFQRVMKNEI